MCLVQRGVAGSVSKLVVGDEVGQVHIRAESLQEFLKNLGQYGAEAHRAVSGYIVGWFARFRNHFDLREFPQKWVVGEAEHTVVEGGEKGDSHGW